MSATSVGHGVINIDVKAVRAAKIEPKEEVVSLISHPISTVAAPAVVQHLTAAQLQAEAESVAAAANQLKTDAANAQA